MDVVALLLEETALELLIPAFTLADEPFLGFFVPLETGTYIFSGVTSLRGTSVSEPPESSSKGLMLTESLVGGQFYSIEGSNMRLSLKSSMGETKDAPIADACLLPLESINRV